MSIEQLIAANTAALTDLAAAIREAGISAATTVVAGATETKSTASTEPSGKIYWHDGENFGVVDTEAEFKKLKKTQAKVFKIPESKYDDLVKAASENTDGEGEDGEVEEKKTTKTTKSSAKSKKTEPTPDELLAKLEEDTGIDYDSVDDAMIKTVFTQLLRPDLEGDARDAAKAFVGTLLKRIGAARATAMEEEHRAPVCRIVLQKVAGFDIDPETVELGSDEEDDQI